MDVTINNQGSLPAYPTFKFTHTSDNAYIGIAGEEGVMALGSQDQTLINTVTTETTKVKSQWLLNPGRKTSQSSNFSGHFVNASDVGNPQNGTLKTAGSLSFKKDGLRLASMGPNPSSGTWTFQGGCRSLMFRLTRQEMLGLQTLDRTLIFGRKLQKWDKPG